MYRGKLLDGQLIAIKRSKQGSMQGGLEFKTEIELLSRVHHNNLVGLVGFCFEKGEKMLVYEFISNGTLSEALYGTFNMFFHLIVRSNFDLYEACAFFGQLPESGSTYILWHSSSKSELSFLHDYQLD